MSASRHDILLVEDNPGDARLIKEMLIDELGRTGFEMRIAESLERALALLDGAESDVVFLDLSLPDSFGLETLYRIQSKSPALPIIVLTGNEDQQLALSAVKAGAQDYLLKNDLSGGLLVKTLKYARERKHIEASLRISEARFRSLAELSSDWYWELDKDNGLTFLSDGFQEQLGVDPRQLIGRAWWDLPGASDGPWETLRESLRRREEFQDVVFRWAVDATEPLHISVSGVPIASEQGFAGYRGVGKDVSARERAAAALRGSEERYRRTMDAARDGIVMLDAEGVITFANRRMASMLGYGEGSLHGVRLSSLVTELQLGERAPESESGDDGIGVSFRRQDGSILFAMQTSYPVHGQDGRHAGTLAIVTDITEFKQREERVQQLAALAAQKSEAERANAAKSRFLAAVSHDLRQPMHALGLFLDDLKSVDNPQQAKVIVGHMQSALDTTYSLLDAILVMSRLETGMIAPNLMAFPLGPMLGRLRQAFGAMARKKELRFTVMPTQAVVMSDPALLERIVANLISNALRYTDQGGVIVACRRRGEAVRLEVWDTGPGIADEHREAIFQEFYRIDRGENTRGGLGLGLAIVRSCTQLLGHPVKLDSTPGRGSRFSVQVAMGQLAAGEPAWGDRVEEEPQSDDFRGLRVLLVDDDQLILDRTCGLLERWGCVVTSASSGPQAEALIEKQGVTPDLILSDLRLDEGELGTSLIERLRAHFRPNLPAIIVTGDTSLNTSRMVRRSGLTLLYKPVPPGKLRAAMHRLLDA
jgi:PAS domain S-box-containing protein